MCRNPLYVQSISVKSLLFNGLFITEYFKIDVVEFYHFISTRTLKSEMLLENPPSFEIRKLQINYSLLNKIRDNR